LVGAGVVIAVAWWAYGRWYARPRDELIGQIRNFEGYTSRTGDKLKDQWSVRDDLARVAASTLGRSEDAVRHRFRTLLGQVAETAGLGQIVVNDARPKPVGSPAAAHRVREFDKKARALADFVLLRGEIKATGPYERCLRLIAMLDAQRWIHRVEGFTLRPASARDRSTFEVRAQVATIYLPDVEPAPIEDDPGVVVAEVDESTWSPLVERNLFVEPVPVAGASTTNPAPPPVAVGPPYAQWRLAGVTVGPEGARAVVVGAGTGTDATLAPGQRIEAIGAAFIRGAGEWAIFEIDGRRVRLRIGQSFAQRQILKDG